MLNNLSFMLNDIKIFKKKKTNKQIKFTKKVFVLKIHHIIKKKKKKLHFFLLNKNEKKNAFPTERTKMLRTCCVPWALLYPHCTQFIEIKYINIKSNSYSTISVNWILTFRSGVKCEENTLTHTQNSVKWSLKSTTKMKSSPGSFTITTIVTPIRV